MIGIFTELKPAIKGVADTLHEAATGTTMMVQGLQLLYTQWKYGMDSPEMKALQQKVQDYAQDEYNERQGISDKPVKSILDLQMEAQMQREKRLNILPASEKESGVLTSEEIRDKKLELRELTNRTIPDLTKELAAARLTGLKTDIEDASIALERATNKANDLKKAVGIASGSAATYNSMFAASLDTGGVGPDVAGFDSLANLSMSELEAIAKGGLGKSKAEAEKAQSYIDRMNAGGAASTETKTAGVSTQDQVAVSTQDQVAVTSANTLTSKLKSAYDEQFENYLKYGNDMMKVTAQYWTTITGFQADALTAMSQADAKFTKFVAENPTIKNIGVVVWTEEGADWNPLNNAEFMQTMRINAVMSNVPQFIKPEFKVNVLVKVDKKGQATSQAEVLTTNVMRSGIGQ
jgi:hypothetical protein